MAGEMQAPAIADTQASKPISEDAATTPVEAEERRASLSSHDSDGLEAEKGQQDVAPSLEKVQSDTEPVYPPAREAIPVVVALVSAIFLLALDRTIIATAIPRMTDEFHSLDDIGWYGSAFMLTNCCFQLLLGRIYTFYTPKYVFLIIIGLFEVGSAICGAAPNSLAFIFGRAIAGTGSAGIMSGAVVLLVSVTPLKKRPMYMGLFGAVFGVASVVGPILGGVFTTDVSWRWCFYINLPIGALTMVVIAFLLKPTEPSNKGLTIRQQLAKLDLLGELFLLPCIICLLLALQWGGSTYSWSDGRIIALFTMFAVLLIAFLLVQVFMQDVATIPGRVIGNRSMLGAMWFTFCLASAMMVIIYYLPIWFQAIKGVSAVESGIRTIPLVLSLVVGVISGGQTTGRIGYYTPLLLASSVVMPIGAGLLTTFQIDSPEGIWIGYQILFGFGLGLGMQQGGLAAQTVLSRKDVPIGVALIFFSQMLGGAIAASVGQNVLDSNLVSGFTTVVKGITPHDIINTGATNLRTVVPPSQLHHVLVVYNAALRQCFIVALAFGCLAGLGAVFVEFRSVKGKEGPTAKGKQDKASKGTKKTASDEKV